MGQTGAVPCTECGGVNGFHVAAFHTREPAFPSYVVSFTCDWGDCDEVSEGWRQDEGGRWLPVCRRHRWMDGNRHHPTEVER